MKREITVPTLGGIYKFTANSPEDEEIIRKVAKAVNSKAEVLQKRYPGKTEAESEAGMLQKELESYLDNIVKI